MIRFSRSASQIQFFVGLAFAGFGTLVFIGTLFTPFPMAVRVFPLVFTIVAVVMTFTGFQAGFTHKGDEGYELERLGANNGQLSFDERLRKLEMLRAEQLISESEYAEKRKKMMEDQW